MNDGAIGTLQANGGNGGAAPAPVGFVTISEAARRLDLNKGTVSRQVVKLGLEKDAHGRILFEDYLRRRETDLNPLMARGGGMAEAGAPAATKERGAAAAGHNASNDLKRLQAQKLQLELDQERGLLVDRAAVASMIQTGTRALRDTLLGLPNRLAADFASMTDVAEIKGRLDAEIRRTLEALAASFAELGEQDEGEGQESEAA